MIQQSRQNNARTGWDRAKLSIRWMFRLRLRRELACTCRCEERAAKLDANDKRVKTRVVASLLIRLCLRQSWIFRPFIEWGFHRRHAVIGYDFQRPEVVKQQSHVFAVQFVLFAKNIWLSHYRLTILIPRINVPNSAYRPLIRGFMLWIRGKPCLGSRDDVSPNVSCFGGDHVPITWTPRPKPLELF